MRTIILCLVLGGCGGGGTDIMASLVFADRTDAELLRLMNAAAGTEMFQTEAQIGQFGDASEPDPCPAITVEGNVATVTGGCTRADGLRIEGSAIVTNPFGWEQLDDAYVLGQPTRYELDEFALIYSVGGNEISFDGYVERSDSFQVAEADITVTQFGVAVRSDLYYRCSNPSNPECTVEGSGIELVGVGGALVSGRLTQDRAAGTQSSDYTLRGADTLTIHSDGRCVAWSIEGTDRGMECE
jgi:hypothetical protein